MGREGGREGGREIGREGGERKGPRAHLFIHFIPGKCFSTPHFLTHTFIRLSSLPPFQQHNDGNYVISLIQLVRWLGEQAEEIRR